MDRDPALQSGYHIGWRQAVAASGMVLVAACTSGYPHKEAPFPTHGTAATTLAPNIPSPTAELSTAPAATPTETPSPTSVPSLENCNSIRAARPGAYFNEGYKSHIQDQLHTMWVALSTGANADINSDYLPWISMSHAMEDDPEYSDAMYRAYTMMTASKQQTGQPQQITADQVLSWQIAAPPTCAPQRLTDAASRKNLQETKAVSGAVFHGLTDHLAGQASRLAQPLISAMEHAWQSLQADIDQQLSKLQNS